MQLQSYFFSRYRLINQKSYYLPNSKSSGSLGFKAKRVNCLNNVANISKLSADLENTGKHSGESSPHIRIITNNSLILLRATISLLMSY